MRTRTSAAETARCYDPAAEPGSTEIAAKTKTKTTCGHASAKNDRGYVTAETALLLPILLGIGYAMVLIVLLAADQIRCADAAWEAARALARGAPAAQLSDIAARYAPSGAHASSWTDGGSLTVEVERDQNVASRFLPSIRISATVTVPCEPHVEGCDADSTDAPRRPDG
jgi:Flp pilus assembly protein TadG